MTIISWQARTKFIFSATKQHALNLAKYVTIYKTLLLLQRKANGGKERGADTFIAGLIGGYFVFGERNPVNEQVRHPTYFIFPYLLKPRLRSCYTSYPVS
jgi:peroxisomal membrane protein 4